MNDQYHMFIIITPYYYYGPIVGPNKKFLYIS